MEHQPIPKATELSLIEFPAMMASLLAAQAGSPAAAAQIDHDVARHVGDCREEALATLMQARPGWRAAVGVLEGSFHPRVARLVGANCF